MSLFAATAELARMIVGPLLILLGLSAAAVVCLGLHLSRRMRAFERQVEGLFSDREQHNRP